MRVVRVTQDPALSGVPRNTIAFGQIRGARKPCVTACSKRPAPAGANTGANMRALLFAMVLSMAAPAGAQERVTKCEVVGNEMTCREQATGGISDPGLAVGIGILEGLKRK